MSRKDNNLIPWIDAKLRVWGTDVRRLRRSAPINLGHGPKADEAVLKGRFRAYEAGWGQSIAGRADEPIGYGEMRDPVDHLRNDARMIQTAINRALDHHRLRYKWHAILHLHYDERVRRVPAKVKCQALGIQRDRYYEILGAAHRVIDSYWPTDMDRDGDWITGGIEVATGLPSPQCWVSTN